QRTARENSTAAADPHTQGSAAAVVSAPGRGGGGHPRRREEGPADRLSSVHRPLRRLSCPGYFGVPIGVRTTRFTPGKKAASSRRTCLSAEVPKPCERQSRHTHRRTSTSPFTS